MRKLSKGSLLILVAILLVSIMSGCSGSNAGPQAAVTAAVAGNRTLKTNLDFSGVLVPNQTVDLSSKISGQVVGLGSKVGGRVKAGDVLIKLDTESLKAQLMQAEAGLQSAQAAAQSAENQAAISKISLNAAQANYDRVKTLFDAGAVSQIQLDDAQDKLNTAVKQYDSTSGATQAQAAAAITTAHANIKNLQVQIDSATIKSPINGIITNQSINLGQSIASNATLISIVDTSVLKMKSTVTQDKLPLLSLGQAVDVSIDSYPDRVFQGTITSVGPIALSTGEVFPVEISMQNESGLMAGLSAHASLTVNPRGIVIPTQSILQSNGKNYVFVIKDHIVSKRLVQTGLSNGNETEILKGLKEGERVAADNVSALTDKMRIDVK